MQSCYTDKDESKVIIVDEYPTEDNESESKVIIVNKFSAEKDKSKCVINKQEDTNNEVTYDVPIYFNVFKCVRNILNRLDVLYERACMATPRDEYYTNILENLVN